jgi:DNA-binding NtrC family response regulator
MAEPSDTKFRRPSMTEKVARHVPATARHFSLQRVDVTSPPVVVTSGRCTIGALAMNELCVDLGTVSRFHCEVTAEGGAPVVKDLGSTNGTHVDGLQVREAFLKDGSLIKLGPVATLRFRLLDEKEELQLSEKRELGELLGESAAMRSCFWQLERAAASSRAVLLEGETGTGKTAAADAIHNASSRSLEPLVTVECGSLTEADLEQVLFGRGEAPKRLSAFEEAGGGTLVLEDVNELPQALQLRLLPVLETGELRRTGAMAVASVRCRLVATTRVDLRMLINEGRFKSELFHRLAVLRIRVPPLRERAEDIPLLVDARLEGSAVTEEEARVVRDPESLARMRHAVWAGNVRELFNYVDRAVTMKSALPPGELAPQTVAAKVDARLPYAEARRIALEHFEVAYVKALLELHGGNVSAAARQTGIDRAYLHRLMRRHGIKS